MYEVTHSRVWLPVWSWADDAAWSRLIDWAEGNCENFADRLIVTPGGNPQGDPQGLNAIAEGKTRITDTVDRIRIFSEESVRAGLKGLQ
jgi:hypothetical protein